MVSIPIEYNHYIPFQYSSLIYLYYGAMIAPKNIIYVVLSVKNNSMGRISQINYFFSQLRRQSSPEFHRFSVRSIHSLFGYEKICQSLLKLVYYSNQIGCFWGLYLNKLYLGCVIIEANLINICMYQLMSINISLVSFDFVCYKNIDKMNRYYRNLDMLKAYIVYVYVYGLYFGFLVLKISLHRVILLFLDTSFL